MSEVKDSVLAYSREIGLDLAGVATPEIFERVGTELEIRREHYAGRYAYRVDKWRELANPLGVMPDAKAVLVLGYFYLADDKKPDGPRGRMGRIVSYGHLGILKRARLMRSFLEKQGYKAVMGAHRKEAAVRAGLGAFGKNNLVINPRYGSWVAYQSIITNAPLEPDKPNVDDVCGKCDKCLKACPTGALYEARRVDPRRCVTCLLTSRDVREEHFPAMSNYILGCDACQEACPRNAAVVPKSGMECLLPATIGVYPPLEMLLGLDENRFQKEIIGSIQDKIASRRFLNRMMKSAVIRRLATFLMKTIFKGKEILPETFVHASGNLEVYKRNAIIAAGNLGDKSMAGVVTAFKSDPYFGPYANWSARRLS